MKTDEYSPDTPLEQPLTKIHHREELRAQLDSLEAEIAKLRGALGVKNGETAERLEQIEFQLNSISHDVLLLEDSNGLDVTRTMLNEIRAWNSFVSDYGFEKEAQRGLELSIKISEQRLARWQEFSENLGEQGNAADYFRALLQTTGMELQCSRNEGLTQKEIEQFREVRNGLREKFLKAIEHTPPTQDLRQQWTASLVDRSAALISDLPDLSPAVAAQQLFIVRDDLEWHIKHAEKEKGECRNRLLKSNRRVRSEWEERVLQSRLERNFGKRFVSISERLLFLLTFVFLALLLIEFYWYFDETPTWLVLADTALCGIFLSEFFTKLSLTPSKWDWFRRHFLIDFLPAIPFGLIFQFHAIDPLRAARLGRLIRLSRFARYIRVARDVVRVFRVIGFLTRGLDRLAKLYAPVLNVNVILYPTLEERQNTRNRHFSLIPQIRKLRAELDERWRILFLESPKEERQQWAERRLLPLQKTYEQILRNIPVRFQKPMEVLREQPADELIRQISMLSPQEIQARLGEDLTSRLAKMLRIISKPPLRWLPLVWSWAPRLGQQMTDAEVVAIGTQNLATTLGRWHKRWFWWADLYGTITPTQFIDRVGTLLIKTALRPAYRLPLLGLFLILIGGVIQLLGTKIDLLVRIQVSLENSLGPPIIIIGAICAIIVGIGFWLQRLAQEATEFYEEAAVAQFLHLTEIIRARYVDRDAAIVDQRVIRPERQFLGNVSQQNDKTDVQKFIAMTKAFLAGDYIYNNSISSFDTLERAVLLHRDSLDGALLADSDTRTTSQLLGNPAIRRLRTWSRRFNSSDEKVLQRLTLTRQKGIGGPYLWFYLITRAIALQTAQLIIDYNRNVIPIEELASATEQESQQFQHWLNQGKFDPRKLPLERREDQFAYCITTAFTALHFLDDDSKRDEEVARRFGDKVLTRLKRDRSQMIRRVFGMYPLHNMPKEKRVFNLHAAYTAWLGSGRVLLLPLFVIAQLIQTLRQVIGWLLRCINEIRTHQTRNNSTELETGDFSTAIRKIDRMRGPVVEASMRLRILVDPEYLGVPIPGQQESTLKHADAKADAHYLHLEPSFLREVDAERSRAEADMQRVSNLIDGGILQRCARMAGLPENAFDSPEHIRAFAVAYLSDYLALRQLLSSTEILEHVFAKVFREPPLPLRPWIFLQRSRAFSKYGRSYQFENREHRKLAWRAVTHNYEGVAEALQVWYSSAENGTKKGEKILSDLLRHPARVTEMLVTLRAVQTLAILDVLNYREHVFRLGEYEEDDADAREMLINLDYDKPTRIMKDFDPAI